MRILVVSEEPPQPVINGLRLQVNALTRELRRRHDVRVIAFGAADATASADTRLVRGISTGLFSRAGRFAASVASHRTVTPYRLARRMRRALVAQLGEFQPDIIHVVPGSMAAVAPLLEGRPAVLAALDADHLNAEARAQTAPAGLHRVFAGEAVRVRQFEAQSYRPFARVVVVSEDDRQALLALSPALRVAVIPNGVDADVYDAACTATRIPGRILFCGVMDYPPNIAAAHFLATEILPRVRRAVPEAHLCVIGRSPCRSVLRLGRLDGIEIVGAVKDVAAWLSTAAVFACPMLYGTGIKNKLLEAMANGLATVVTTRALRGNHAVPGRDTLVADDADGFAHHMTSILSDPELAARLGSSARDCVRAQHTWDAAARAFEDVYQDATAATLGTTR